jgi:ribosomal protein S18 acetylase RimI-like enzyme
LITKIAAKKGMSLRLLNPARDLRQLADLIENAFGHELSDEGERALREIRLLGWLGPLNTFFTVMSSEVDGMFTGYVWEQDGRVVGNVTVNRPTRHPWRWQISNVAVLDTYRRRGIGRQLVEAAIDLILTRGGRTAYLFVRDNNAPAVRLYRSFGFIEVDRTTELVFDPSAQPIPDGALHVLRPLRLQEDEALYELASGAAGSGYRWLYTVRRGQFVRSWDERFARRIGALFCARSETRWSVSVGSRLDVGVSLRATRLWNLKPHRLQLWVRPSRRGTVEEVLAQDVIALLSRYPRRLTYLSLPACEENMIAASIERGFRKVRTLTLMKLEV